MITLHEVVLPVCDRGPPDGLLVIKFCHRYARRQGGPWITDQAYLSVSPPRACGISIRERVETRWRRKPVTSFQLQRLGHEQLARRDDALAEEYVSAAVKWMLTMGSWAGLPAG